MSKPGSSSQSKGSGLKRILPSSAKTNEVVNEATAALITTLTILKESVEGVPGLKNAVGGLLEVVKAVDKTKENAKDLESLRNHISQLNTSIVNSIGGGKMDDDLKIRVDTLTGDLLLIRADYRKMSKKNTFRQFFSVHDHATTIAGLDRMLDRAIQAFMVGAVIQTEQIVKKIAFTQ
ncbi:hypothetical protein FRC02_005482, partial [Tulasnella sp. 418]